MGLSSWACYRCADASVHGIQLDLKLAAKQREQNLSTQNGRQRRESLERNLLRHRMGRQEEQRKQRENMENGREVRMGRERQRKRKEGLERRKLEREGLERRKLERECLERRRLEREYLQRRSLERRKLERESLERRGSDDEGHEHRFRHRWFLRHNGVLELISSTRWSSTQEVSMY